MATVFALFSYPYNNVHCGLQYLCARNFGVECLSFRERLVVVVVVVVVVVPLHLRSATHKQPLATPRTAIVSNFHPGGGGGHHQGSRSVRVLRIGGELKR